MDRTIEPNLDHLGGGSERRIRDEGFHGSAFKQPVSDALVVLVVDGERGVPRGLPGREAAQIHSRARVSAAPLSAGTENQPVRAK